MTGREDEDMTQTTLLNWQGVQALHKASEDVERVNKHTLEAMRELYRQGPVGIELVRARITTSPPPPHETQVMLRPIAAPGKPGLKDVAAMVFVTSGVLDQLWLARDGHHTIFVLVSELDRHRDIRISAMLLPYCDMIEIMTASVPAHVSGAVSLGKSWKE